MARNDYILKVLVLIVVVSYFLYAFYWFVKSLFWVVEISITPGYYYPPAGLIYINSYGIFAAFLMEYFGFIGLIIRVLGACFAVFSAFYLLKGDMVFSLVRGKVSKALLCEGLYFLSFIPSIYFLLAFSTLSSASKILLSAALSMQILLISPFLVMLALKVKKYQSGVDEGSLLRLAGLSSMNYVIAFWIAYMLKWTEIIPEVNLYWLITTLNVTGVLGFLNTVIVLSLSVVFAVLGEFYMLRESGGNKAMKLWGLSLIFLSAHFIIYVFYCANTAGMVGYIWFGELYFIPLFLIGVYFLLKNHGFKR